MNPPHSVTPSSPSLETSPLHPPSESPSGGAAHRHQPALGISLSGPALTIAERVADQLPGYRGRDQAAVRLGIAFSGGVDSAALTAAAVWALGADAVVAVLAVSPSLARRERALAHQVADQIGVALVEVETHEQDSPDYLRNGADRCYFCKDELFTRLDTEVTASLGLTAVAYGENADDAERLDRPGAQAATDHGVLRPLAAAGVTKDEVRTLARGFGLSVADKPAAPCLASRIPHGEPVTPEKLAAIDAAEAAVLALGFSDCRVRHHGEIARIEIPVAEFDRVAQVRTALQADVAAVGFRFVTLDLAGIQSGAFTLPLVQVTRGRS